MGRHHYPHDVKWLKALAGVYLKSDNHDRLAEALAEQLAVVQKAYLNRVPSAASASMWGVLTAVLP